MQWYSNGRKMYEENYKNGLLDGPAKNWHRDGKHSVHFEYKDGKVHGQWCRLGENDEKLEEKFYKNGELNGLHTTWYVDGQKSTEVYYDNGKKIRETSWGPDGREVSNDAMNIEKI